MDEELLNAFRVFDLDGDGHIDMAEFKQAMSGRGEKMSDEEMAKIMASVLCDARGWPVLSPMQRMWCRRSLCGPHPPMCVVIETKRGVGVHFCLLSGRSNIYLYCY